MKPDWLILKIAYRNLWRRRSRSFTVVAMIAVGLALLIFMSGLYEGWVAQMIDDALESDSGQLTIYQKDYRLSQKLSDSFKYDQEEINKLTEESNVLAIVPRLKNEGLISSARNSQGVQIQGVDIEKERGATNLERSLKLGAYKLPYGEKMVIIGADLADELKVKPGKKVVIMGQASDRSIASAAFRVAGVVRTNNPAIDKYAAFINLTEAQELFQLENTVSQIAIFIKESSQLEQTKLYVTETIDLKNRTVYTWKELFKSMEWMQDMMVKFNQVSFMIVFVVVAIGIFNVVLISIMERVRELGIMMAVGTRFWQIARMIVCESLIIGLLGFIFGSLFGFLLLIYFKRFGLDLSAFAEGLEAFGFAAVMRPIIKFSYFSTAFNAVFITSFLASLWPIRILKKLKPVESIHFN